MLDLTLALLAFAAMSGFAEAGTPAGGALHFAWVRHGVDGAGRSSFEKVTLLPSGKLQWATAARGGECPGEAGDYEIPLTDPERATLRELARAAARELAAAAPKKGPLPKPRRRESRLLLSVFDGGRSTSIEVSKGTSAYETLMNRLANLKSLAKPLSAVRFSVSRGAEGRILGRFEHLGREGFPFVVPREAGDAFTVAGRPGRYAAPPARLQTVLSPEQRSLEVALAPGKGAKGDLEVHFSSAIAVHHFAPATASVSRDRKPRRKGPARSRAIEQALRFVPEAREVWLCARINTPR